MSVSPVMTWNVLHWVHARNHQEDLSAFATEAERTRAVVERVAEVDAQAACLQEVSGDACAVIAARFGAERVHRFQFPRMPRLKVGASVLRDESENLVIVSAGVKVHAQAFSDDGGKGFIAVRHPSDTLVVSTHVAGDPQKRSWQLHVLDKWIANQAGPVILCGDFNIDVRKVLESLRPGWQASRFRTALSFSRPKSNQLIDHIVHRGRPEPTFVRIEDAGGISDHNLVISDGLC